MEDSEGEKKYYFSEEEMINFLSSKYHISVKDGIPAKKHSHGYGRGIKPTFFSFSPSAPPTSPPQFYHVLLKFHLFLEMTLPLTHYFMSIL
jgi:hypothetical protein